MICNSCKKEKSILFMVEKIGYCLDCKLKIHPPSIHLLRKWDDERLFHIIWNRSIPASLEDLLNCGFKIYKHREYLSRSRFPDYKETFLLRYYGNMRCLMLNNCRELINKPLCRAERCVRG
jgi:hypothetical protein